MSVSRAVFVRQTGTAPSAVGTTPLEARLAMAGLLAENSPGVPRSGLLFNSNANVVTANADMSYSIASCNPVINRAVNEGVYVFTASGTTTVTTIAAPGSGSRWDLIYVKQDDPDKGDPDNLPIAAVIQGTATTGTPTKPYSSVPAGGLVLAEAQIFSGTAGASAPPNTLSQVWLHTACRGAPIPVRNTTERGAITPFSSLSVRRLDQGGVTDLYYNGQWNAGDTGWVTPTIFGNGFTGYVGSGYNGVRVRIINGIVMLNGAAICTINWTQSTAMFQLPTGYWPARKVDAGNCVVDVDGNVYPSIAGTGGSATSFSADWPLG